MLSTNLLSVICLSLLAFANAQCEEKIYKCLEDETKVVIYNMELECPAGYVCNDKNIAPCGPCVKKTERCGFRCQDDHIVIGGVLVACPKNYICNSEQTADCNYCTRAKCPATSTKIFHCDPEDKTKLTIVNIQAQCDEGYECNANFVEPCHPCIDATIEFEDIPTTEESQETCPEDDPESTEGSEDISTTQENEESKEVQITTEGSEVNPETEENEVTTTEGVLVTTEEYIPNCNDGKGRTEPCRAANSQNYFQCQFSWFKYKAKRMDCADLETDTKCRNVEGLCE